MKCVQPQQEEGTEIAVEWEGITRVTSTQQFWLLLYSWTWDQPPGLCFLEFPLSLPFPWVTFQHTPPLDGWHDLEHWHYPAALLSQSLLVGRDTYPQLGICI